MIHSIKNEIEKLYPQIGEILTYAEVQGGFLSHNNRIITSNGEYFLKIVRSSVGIRMAQIMEIETLCYENGIPVMLPLFNTYNAYWSVIDNHTCIMYPFIKKRSYEGFELSETMIESFMENLARIHALPCDITGKEPADNFLIKLDKKNALEKFAKINEKTSLKDWGDDEFIEIIKKSIFLKTRFIENYQHDWNSRGFGSIAVTHGDYHSKNIFFNEDGSVSHIFDFEKTEYNYRACELARTIRISCFQHGINEHDINRARMLIRSYQKHSPLSRGVMENSLRYSFSRLFFDSWVEGEHVLLGNHKVDHFIANLLPVYEELEYEMDSIIQKICKDL